MFLHKFSAISLLLFGVISTSYCQTIQLKPFKDSELILSEGNELHDQKKYEEAISHYNKIDFRDENYVLAQYEIALSLEASEKEAEAITLLKTGIKTYAKDYVDSYLLLANIMDNQYGLDSSAQYYDLGSKTFPFEHKFYSDKAVAYYHVKNLDETIKNLQKSINLNFFNATAHRNLAIICFEQNQLSRGALSLWTYLTLNPADSRVIGTISTCEPYIFEKLVMHPDSLLPYGWNSTFTKQDLILKSKAAFDEKYELQSVHNFKIIRQFQVLMSQLKFDAKSNDFWMKKYVPIYEKVYAENKYSLLTDYWLSGVTEEAKKRRESNNDKILLVVNELLEKIRDQNRKKNLPGYLDDEQVFVEWDEDGYVSNIIENYSDGKYAGNVVKVNKMGKVIGRGTMNADGKLSGKWKQFDTDNVLEQEVNYIPESDSLNYIIYAKNGNKIDIGGYKNQMLSGPGKINFPNGNLKTKTSYLENYYDGKYEEYFTNGKPYLVANYANGIDNGIREEYFNSGQLKIRQNFVDGKLEGKYEQYFQNGQLNIKGDVVNDKLEGQWLYYFSNGKIFKELNFKNGMREGRSIQYYANGQKLTECFYKKDKKEDLEIFYDREANPYLEKTYKDDNLIRARGLKPRNQSYDVKVKKNQIEYLDFYASGRLFAKGNLVDGLLEGMIYTYYPNGEIQTSCNYEKGLKNGEFKSYAKLGYLSYEYFIKNDTLSGEYRSYYPNGAIELSGYYTSDVQEGTWLGYNEDGNLLTDSFFKKGVKENESYTYWPDGTLNEISKYKKGVLVSFEQFDKAGKSIQKSDLDNGNGELVVKHLNGKVKSKGTYLSGNLNGEFLVTDSKGNILEKDYYILGELNKEKEYYNPLGTKIDGLTYIGGLAEGIGSVYNNKGLVESEITYIESKREGLGTYYINGKLNLRGNYAEGEKNGDFVTYDFDGKTPGAKLVYENGILVGYASPLSDNSWSPIIEIPQDQTVQIKVKYATGQPSFEATVKRGLFEGTKKEFGKNGKPIAVSNYKSFLNEGPSEEYYEDGKILSSLMYKNNSLNGPAKVYHKNGQVFLSKNYDNNRLNGPYVFYNEKGEVIYKTNYYYDEEF